MYLVDVDGTAMRLLPEHADLVVEFRGRYTIGSPPPGVRPPGWAAREAMVTAGVATDADVRRWERVFQEAEAAPVRPTLFAPMFTAVGRRPA